MQSDFRFLLCSGLQLALLLGPACSSGGTERFPAREEAWFVDAGGDAGLDFELETAGRGDLHMPEIMNGGVGLFDYDNDGDLDIYFVNGSAALHGEPGESAAVNRLYRQERDGRLTDVTEVSGLGDPGYGMGVAVGDADNDGDRDVYVTNYGADRFYRNLGDGTFRDETEEAGIDVGGWSASAAFFDYDRDGYLDLYVARYVRYDPEQPCFDPAGRRDYCGPRVFLPEQDRLLHNEGDGTFRDVTAEAGILETTGAGLGVGAEDLDDDGWVDLYVANDGWPNQLWINRRDGSFIDRALLAGVAFNLGGRPEAGMGVLTADLDNDGRCDLFVTHIVRETNTAYRNLGPGRGFVDSTGAWGLATSSLKFTGMGSVAFDVELDGDLDLLVANGGVIRNPDWSDQGETVPFEAYAQPNLFYVNQGGGRFEPDEERAAAFTRPLAASRGLAAGDLDADGDFDLVISNAELPAGLYRNEAPRRGRWLQVRAIDPRLGRAAIGARVELAGEEARLTRTISRAVGYLSSGPAVAHFGVPFDHRYDRIELRWPDGLRERFPLEGLDREMVVYRGKGEEIP